MSLVTMNRERQEPRSWDVLFDLSSWHPKPPQGVRYCCPIVPLVGVRKYLPHAISFNCGGPALSLLPLGGLLADWDS